MGRKTGAKKQAAQPEPAAELPAAAASQDAHAAPSKQSKKKAKALLADAGDAQPSDERLRVNTKFAREFEAKKRKEELTRMERRGAQLESEDESDSETEDEDGEELTPELDADIMKTLRLIRKRDPAIYDSKIAFFDKTEGDDDDDDASDEDGARRKKKPAKKADAPLYYKDLVRQQVIAGEAASDEEEEAEEAVMTYGEEQVQLKKAFLASVETASEDEEQEEDKDEADGDDSDLDGGLFTLRKKTADEQQQEDAEYAQFTTKYGSKLQAAELDPDAFLDKYLSSEGWKDKSDTIPHYDDIVKDDEEDAEALEKADNFEHSYNFRFEEDGGGVIQTHSRHVEDSMRRVDDSRKRKREERKARKALERQKKEEELRRLKNLKQAEIEAKLEKVARLMGQKSGGDKTSSEQERLKVLASDLEGDFDPEEYDKRMQQIFDEEYYDEGDEGDDMEKPTWDDEEDKALFAGLPEDPEDEEMETEQPDVEQEDDEGNNGEEDEDDEQDEADDEEQDEEQEGGDEQLQNMSAKEMARAKQKYLDELYGLDYEDLIGDLKCRFKYRQVRTNDFGLTVEEIMAADDKELKGLVSLKRLAPYVEEEFDVDRRKLKRFKKTMAQAHEEKEEAREAKRKQREETRAAQEVADGAGEQGKKKRKRTKKGKKAEASESAAVSEKEVASESGAKDEAEPAAPVAEGKKKRRSKKKKGQDKSAFASTGLSSSRLESYKLVKSK